MWDIVGVSDTAAVPLYGYSDQPQPVEWCWRRYRTRRRLFVPSSTHSALLPHVRRRRLDAAWSVAEPTRYDSGRSSARRPRSKTAVNSYNVLSSTVLLISHAYASRGDMLFTLVCLSAYPHDISKTDATIGSPKLKYKCSTMSPANPFILRSKGQRSRSRVTRRVPASVFALLWVQAFSSLYWKIAIVSRCHVVANESAGEDVTVSGAWWRAQRAPAKAHTTSAVLM